MSNGMSVLQGKSHVGEVSVNDMGLRGMVTLRADLSDPKVAAICTALAGVSMPAQGFAAANGDKGLFWMSPDEVLIMLPYAEVPAALQQIENALEGQHHLAVDVSDARAVMQVTGPFAREVIAKLAPVDVHPDSFPVGRFRRTRLGQVAAAFWLRDKDTFEVICFRSVAEYAFDLIAASANSGPVGHL